jgi:hypothetical protein
MILMRRQFVIQQHCIGITSHFDLMIEDGLALATWQLPELPGRRTLPARRLPPHRLAYLSYQGEVSGGRGSVRPADAGQCQVLRQQDDLWEIRLEGREVRGDFLLRRLDDQQWELLAIGAPPGSEPSAGP